MRKSSKFNTLTQEIIDTPLAHQMLIFLLCPKSRMFPDYHAFISCCWIFCSYMSMNAIFGHGQLAIDSFEYYWLEGSCMAIKQHGIFPIVCSSAWNSLPPELSSLPRYLYSSFWGLLKTVRFARAFVASASEYHDQRPGKTLLTAEHKGLRLLSVQSLDWLKVTEDLRSQDKGNVS